jgi:hypothetical protein
MSMAQEAVREYRVTMTFTPTPWQRSVLADPHQFIVICAGRRTGKTILAITRCIKTAVTLSGSKSWYVAPTYGMAKSIAWGELKSMLEPFRPTGIIAKVLESDLEIRLTNGSMIQLKGADYEDSLRGVGLDLAVLDEYAMMKRAVWDAILRPSVIDKNGSALFISTPAGYNHFHELYQKEIAEPGSWKSYHFKTIDNPHIDRDEIEKARRDMDPRAFRQEFEASFESFGGQVFPDFSRELHVKGNGYDPALEYIVGLDFGWASPMAGVLMNIGASDHVHVFAELGMRETPIAVYADKLKAMTPGKLPSMIGCDPAGDAKNEATGSSPVEEMRKAFGYDRIKYHKKYPGVVQDRVELIRRFLRNGKLTFSRACPKMIQAMESYRYPDPKGDIRTEIPLKDGVADHWVDGLGEGLINRFPIRQSGWGVLQ